MNTLAVSVGYPLATWKELWDELESEQNGEDITPPDLSRVINLLMHLGYRGSGFHGYIYVPVLLSNTVVTNFFPANVCSGILERTNT